MHIVAVATRIDGRIIDGGRVASAQVQVLQDLLHEKRMKSMARNRKNDSVNGFVEDGYAHAVQRRRLRGEMEQEIARLVADRAKSISPTALF
jgi:hypothetical protein